jgi:ribosomal protein S27E
MPDNVPRRKWARAKGAGAHGLRRGAWYLVVNDAQPAVVIVYVRKRNVPIPRSMLDIIPDPPSKWSVVKWQETQRGARRASEQNMGLIYIVCPSCGERTRIEPTDAKEMTCPHCGKTSPIDWDHPC